MKRVPGSELAVRAGVDPGYVVRLVDLGILEPDDEGLLAADEARKARMMQLLEDAGLPLVGLGQVVRNGDVSLAFIDDPAFARWAAHSDRTFRSLSDETGVPVELLLVIREVMGSVPTGPDDLVREDELRVIPLVAFQHQRGFRHEVIERSLRVVGESLRRVADTEADWWRTEVMMPLRHAESGPTAMLDVSLEVTPVMSQLLDQTVTAIYHGHQARGWMRNIMEGLEAVLARAGLYTPPERLPAMCFLDLTGFTRLTEEQGDQVAARLARHLATLVQSSSLRFGGTAVKWLGDGVMFHFPVPTQGVLAAIDMVETARSVGLPPAHVGLHAGPVLFQEGDYFGQTVNVTSRVADYARPGEVLVTGSVVEASDGSVVEFEEIGAVDLKGVSAAMELYRARRVD